MWFEKVVVVYLWPDSMYRLFVKRLSKMIWVRCQGTFLRRLKLLSDIHRNSTICTTRCTRINHNSQFFMLIRFPYLLVFLIHFGICVSWLFLMISFLVIWSKCLNLFTVRAVGYFVLPCSVLSNSMQSEVLSFCNY